MPKQENPNLKTGTNYEKAQRYRGGAMLIKNLQIGVANAGEARRNGK
ncbi:hypothetical protein [Oryzisolibacter sp. LB2S]